MLQYFAEAMTSLLTPGCLALVFAGIMLGVVFGAIPGLGGGLLTVLVLPMTYKMGPVIAIAFLCAIYVGGTSGSFIGSVLMGIPGDVASISTCFDGYQFTKKGDPVRALSACTVANFIGTVPAMIVAMIACPVIASIAVKLGPWEFFALGMCALAMIVSLSKGKLFKGLMSTGLGILIKCIGMAPVCGTSRFTFGSYYLSGGVSLSCMMLGVFATATVLVEYARGDKATLGSNIKVSRFRWPGKDLLNNVGNIIRSWVIGLVIGFLPGMGSGLSNVVAYAQAKSSSKHADEFGKGCIDGVIAPEVANNASVGGALIPFIALGIPGDGSTALLLGALTVQGVVTGPLMIRNYPAVVYMIYLACIFSAICVLIFEMIGMPIFPAMLKIPYHFLYPCILLLILVGAYTSSSNMFSVVCCIGMGFVGLFMSWADLPTTPFMLSFVLGELLETNMRRALSYSANGWVSFLTRPVSCVLLVIAFLMIVVPIVRMIFAAMKNTD
ncbi:MAG: tripartite tricarboxylate transporter permease [Clostridiales bacterium]|nr:tripartite tricarboxylate transporter permease [Clostridiales bacterium]